MDTYVILAAVIGFIQGYFGLIYIIGLGGSLLQESSNFWKHNPLRLTKFVTSILVYVFMIIFFFGIAAAWIDLLSHGDEATKANLAKIWGKGWLIGLIIFLLLPAIEGKFGGKQDARR